MDEIDKKPTPHIIPFLHLSDPFSQMKDHAPRTFAKEWVISALIFTVSVVYVVHRFIYQTSFPNLIQLTQVHLAYSYSDKRHTSMYITWQTHTIVDYCTVQYQGDDTPHKFLFISNFTHDLSEGKNVNFVYKVRLSELVYNTKYIYSIQCHKDLLSEEKSGQFLSNPGKRDNVSLLLLGDWATAGTGRPGNKKQAQTPRPNVLQCLLQETDFSSIWHLGDIAYNLHNVDGRRGDQYFEDIEPVVGRKAYMAVPGNHEAKNRFRHYNQRFEFPSVSTNNLYYSLDVGRAHIIMLCTDFEPTVPNRDLSDPEFQESQYTLQKDWLLRDLKSAQKNRSKFPWLIVMGHKPLYCSSNPESTMMQRVCIHEAEKMRESFEEIFSDFGVNLYLSGHLHLYERLDPVFAGLRRDEQVVSGEVYRTGTAPVYVVNGVAGNLESEEIVMKKTDSPLPYSVHINESLGYGFLHIVNKTHLLYEQIAVGNSQFDSIDTDLWATRRLVDRFWVVNNI